MIVYKIKIIFLWDKLLILLEFINLLIKIYLLLKWYLSIFNQLSIQFDARYIKF